jgi:hypothetical protein
MARAADPYSLYTNPYTAFPKSFGPGSEFWIEIQILNRPVESRFKMPHFHLIFVHFKLFADKVHNSVLLLRKKIKKCEALIC